MGKPMDYSSAAGTYANHRWALPWKLAPLCAALAVLREPCEVLEVGCGTGDYLRALHERFPAARCRGFDRNLERYPDLGQLEALATRAGFRLESRRTASGELALDDRFLATLAQRALSESRLIDPEEHKQGLAEARAMQARGDGWRSQTTALTWTRH
jgi:hypothetical protein